MVIENVSVSLFDSFIQGVLHPAVSFVRYIVGGIFGIYVILVFLRWFEYKRLTKYLKNISLDVSEIKNKICGRKKKK